MGVYRIKRKGSWGVSDKEEREWGCIGERGKGVWVYRIKRRRSRGVSDKKEKECGCIG